MNERGIKAKVSVPRDDLVVRPNDITWKSLNQQRECASFGRRVRLSKTKNGCTGRSRSPTRCSKRPWTFFGSLSRPTSNTGTNFSCLFRCERRRRIARHLRSHRQTVSELGTTTADRRYISDKKIGGRHGIRTRITALVARHPAANHYFAGHFHASLGTRAGAALCIARCTPVQEAQSRRSA